MRIRLPELLPEGMTPYSFAKGSEGRISLSIAYRLARRKGRVANFDADILATQCDVLGAPAAELLELVPDLKAKRG